MCSSDLHQGYGNYSVSEEKLIKAINDALEKAWQKGAVEAQNDAAKEIRENERKANNLET